MKKMPCFAGFILALSLIPYAGYATAGTVSATEEISAEDLITKESTEAMTEAEATAEDEEPAKTEATTENEEPAKTEATTENEEPAKTEATTETEIETASLSEESESETPSANEIRSIDLAASTRAIRPGVPLPDGDILFAMYIEHLFPSSAIHSESLSLDRSSAFLTGANAQLFSRIKSFCQDVSAGTIADTLLTIPTEELALPKTSWTADELGVGALFSYHEDDGFYHLTDEANDALYQALDFDLSHVISILLSELPYEFYWFDKTYDPYMQLDLDFYQDPSDTEHVLVQCVSLAFPVSPDYACLEGDSYYLYRTDTEKARAAQTAAKNAQQIVARFASASDLEKLNGYRREICLLSSYNRSAAYDYDMPYGDPWQLVWVFDGDPSTEVVCEGYAKAFQYLCDQTAFDAYITCSTVTGDVVGSGPHMWNILHMDDGRNYLVDITNCDTDMIGADSLLFLSAASRGSLAEGYTHPCGGISVTYQYDDNALGQFTDAELSISTTPYREAAQPDPEAEENSLKIGWNPYEEGWYYSIDGSTFLTGWLLLDQHWYYLDPTGKMHTGWLVKNGTRYYFSPSGAMCTGWRNIDGYWYHFSKSGAMKTGWFYAAPNWYYANRDGVMQTGWLYDRGATYFFTGSGAMATGWKLVDGAWYYFSESGAMKTGWISDRGHWYYIDELHQLLTGWQEIDGEVYYFRPSGTMATGWLYEDGSWYCFTEIGTSCRSRWYKNYYFKADGTMAAGEWIGNKYYVDEDGLWRGVTR